MQDRIQQQIQDELTKTLEGAYMDALDRGHNVISGNGIEARIKQMAVEAGLLEPRYGWATVPPSYRAALESFARLVAEDCVAVVDGADTPDGWSNSHISDAIRARYAETKEPT